MINRRYHISRRIGGGGSGEVFIVQDILRDEKVALKLFSPSREINEESVRREFDFLSGFAHPGLIRVYEFGKVRDSGDPVYAGRYYYTMELLKGSDALEYFAQKPIGPAKVALLEQAFIQTLAALDCIHRQDVIHYDIKPQNIFVNSSGSDSLQVKLIDFGFSTKTIDSSGAPPLRGTLEYMAPEILQGKIVDPRVDLYSLGMTFRHLWSGESALKGASPMDLIRTIVNEDAPPLDRSGSSILPELIERLSERDPGARWSSAREVLIRLAAAGHASAVRKALAAPVGELFVGRATELSLVERAVERSLQAGAPSSTILVIEGVQGSGKTSLLRQIKRRLTRFSPPAIVVGPAPSRESFDDELRRMSEIRPAEGPFVLLIDNIDRRDEEPSKVLARIRECAGRRKNPVFILASSDDADLSWAALDGEEVVRMTLDELPKTDVRSLFHRVLTSAAVPEAVLDSFYASYGGNPHIVAEALRALIGAIPLLPAHDAPGEQNAGRDIGEILTRTLDTYFVKRYEALPREKQLILEVLSCIELSLDVTLLGTIVPFQVGRLNAFLRSLDRGKYIAPAGDQTRYSIRHASLQKRIYAALSHTERESLHRFIAVNFEKLAGAVEGEHTPEVMKELARQFQGSGDREKAAMYYEKAGDLSSNRGNHEDAQRFYGLAVKCDGLDKRQFSHLKKFAHAMSAAGNHAESAEIYKNMLEDLPSGDSLRPEIGRELGKTLVKLGVNKEALLYLEAALDHPLQDQELFEVREEILSLKTVEGLCDDAILMGDRQRELALRLSDRELLALVETDVGIAQFYKGALAESHDCFKKAYRIYRENGNREKTVVLLNNMGNVLSAMGETRSALASWQEALGLAGDHAARHERGQILNNMGIAHYKLQEFDEARGHYAEARRIFGDLKSQNGLAFSLTNLGEVECAEGNYEATIECWTNCLDLYREMQDSLGVGQTLLGLAGVYAIIGLTPRLTEVLDETAATVARHNLDLLVPFLSYVKGQQHFLAGDYPGSLEAYRRSEELFGTTPGAFTCGAETPADRIIQLAFRRAEVYRAMGSYGEALRALECIGSGVSGHSLSLQAEYACNLGLTALHAPAGRLYCGHPLAKPITYFQQGIALIEHEHVTEMMWRLSLALGTEYHKRGNREKAREWLGNASAIVGHLASTFSSPELREVYLSSEGRKDLLAPASRHDCSLHGSDAS